MGKEETLERLVELADEFMSAQDNESVYQDAETEMSSFLKRKKQYRLDTSIGHLSENFSIYLNLKLKSTIKAHRLIEMYEHFINSYDSDPELDEEVIDAIQSAEDTIKEESFKELFQYHTELLLKRVTSDT